MNSLNLLKCSALQLYKHSLQSSLNASAKQFSTPPQSDEKCCCLPIKPPGPPPEKKPCFDHRNLIIERGNSLHAKMIRNFLYAHYWPREPSVVSLWMSQECQYLDLISDKYANSGDRFLAYEILRRTGVKKLVGVCVVNKTFPWMVNELEEWAHFTTSKPERHRMYFCAHCLKSLNLFAKYNSDFIYDVEILGTIGEVAAQGVATRLLTTVLNHADDVRYPLVQVVAFNHYVSKICERCGMTREWSMKYKDYVDYAGRNVFFPRLPHDTVSVYVKHTDYTKPPKVTCAPKQ